MLNRFFQSSDFLWSGSAKEEKMKCMTVWFCKEEWHQIKQSKLFILNLMKVKETQINELTKDKCIQTFIWHELIDQHLFLSFNTTSKKSHKITMLKLGDDHHLIHELFQPLSR